MRTRASLALLLLLGASLSAAPSSRPANPPKPWRKIRAADAIALLNAVRRGAPVTPLDLRSPFEFDQGHLPHAVNVPADAATFRAQLAKLDRKTPWLLYDRAGFVSAKVMDRMEDLGFKEAWILKGGLAAWRAKGYPVAR